MGIFNWKKFPYTNFHDLNLDYFINKFNEIFSEWETLYNTMNTWKDETDTELEEWKTGVENGITTRELELRAELNEWKTQTETDISTWETATLNALNAWKTATTAIFEQIRDDAAGSAETARQYASGAYDNAQLAYQYKLDAEAAANSVSSSAAQIQTNTSDISDLKTQLNHNKTATPGYMLRATNDGIGTEWAPVGTPTDAQAESAIRAWLNEHPEATTTVQDHSLTYEKLINGTLGFVTPEMYGAKGDGVTDDTQAINNALQAGYPLIVFTQNYAVETGNGGQGSTGLGIEPASNTTLLFLGSKLIGIPNEYQRYQVINVKDVHNVNIIGAEIECDKALNSGQWGFGIRVQHSHHINIENCIVYDALGDCIVVGVNNNNEISNDINISRCELYGARRQGITITGANRVVVDGCYIHDISGEAPQDGIDIEPDSSNLIENIIISDTKIENTNGRSVDVANGVCTTGVKIYDCDFDNSIYVNTGHVKVYNTKFKSAYVTENADNKCLFFGCELYLIILLQSAIFKNCSIIIDDVINNVSNTAYIPGSGTVAEKIIGLFDGCTIKNLYSMNSRGPSTRDATDFKFVFRNCDILYNLNNKLITANGFFEYDNCRINITNRAGVQASVFTCTGVDFTSCYITHDCPTVYFTSFGDGAYRATFFKNIVKAATASTVRMYAGDCANNILIKTTLDTTGQNVNNTTLTA